MFQPGIQAHLPTLLKTATESAHRDLETALQPQWSRMSDASNYRRLLEVFYGFYAPLEGSITTHLPGSVLPDLDMRRKASWILEDLRVLGHDVVPPHCSQPPAIDSADAAMGALYVLEGSTLGGRHICKLVRRGLPGAPLRFFEGYGPATGPNWIRFQQALEAWGENNDSDAVVTAANQTFEKFRLWIKQTL
jgi:heme oxygenase